MKLAKAVLPFSVLALIGIICAVLFNKGGASGDENQLGAALGYFFTLVLNIVPMALFIPFGVAFIICEICLFCVRNPIPTMIAVLVLKCLLLPVLLFTTLTVGGTLLTHSALFGAIIIGCAVLYGACLVALFVSYFTDRKYYRN